MPYCPASRSVSDRPKRSRSLSNLKQRPSGPLTGIVWRPDGNAFIFLQSGKVHFYDIATRNSRELFSLDSIKVLNTRGTKPATDVPPQPFGWENRSVTEKQLQWTPDGRSILIQQSGDLFLFPTASSGGFVQLTDTPAIPERDPQLSPDGKRVAFRREHDLYVLDLETRRETALTTTVQNAAERRA